MTASFGIFRAGTQSKRTGAASLETPNRHSDGWPGPDTEQGLRTIFVTVAVVW